MSVQGIIGKKVGMTQVFADDGRAFPVTVIEAGPGATLGGVFGLYEGRHAHPGL